VGCRHVDGAQARGRLRRGKRMVRVAPKLIAETRRPVAETRRPARSAANSDVIDAVAVARAANDLRCQPHDLSTQLETPRPHRALTGGGGRSASRAAGHGVSKAAQIRIARDELRRIRELSRSIDALERELAALVAELRPRLPAERVRGAHRCQAHRRDRRIGRFATDATLARLWGSPIGSPSSASASDRQPSRRRNACRAAIPLPGTLTAADRRRRHAAIGTSAATSGPQAQVSSRSCFAPRRPALGIDEVVGQHGHRGERVTHVRLVNRGRTAASRPPPGRVPVRQPTKPGRRCPGASS
jgi:hypothetical protein